MLQNRHTSRGSRGPLPAQSQRAGASRLPRLSIWRSACGQATNSSVIQQEEYVAQLARLSMAVLKPAVILVEPQMAENIGAAARAMKNFGLYDLRLVRPRDGWPNPGALATASHAADLIHAAPVYDSVADAIADLDRVYASTARSRFMHKAFVTTRQLPSDLLQLLTAAAAAEAEPQTQQHQHQHQHNQQLLTDAAPLSPPDSSSHPVLLPPASAAAPGPTSSSAPLLLSALPIRAPRAGILFGRESSGLTNEEVAMANKIVTIEADPVYPVLNLAQAIVCTSYELYGARLAVASRSGIAPNDEPNPQGGGSPSPPPPPTAVSSTPADSHQSQQPAPQPTSPTQPAPQHTPPHPQPALSPPVSPPPAAGFTTGYGTAGGPRLATRGELDNYLNRLVGALDGSGFFESADKRPATLLSIRNLAGKVEGLTSAEVALLHGMLSKLMGLRGQGRGRGRASSAADGGQGEREEAQG